MSQLNQQQKEALGRMMVEGFKKGDPAIIEGLLKRGADPDVLVQDGDKGPWRPVMHWATSYFNEKGMQAMLDHGANIEAKDPSGNTALMFAITNYSVASVEFLMKHGADPVAQNSDGVVALDLARKLSAEYSSWSASRDKIIKALSGDYSSEQQPEPVKEALPPPVTFQDKPHDQKFRI